MNLYTIRRRNAWASAEELEAAAARSAAEGDKEGSGVRWIRSYVVHEDNGHGQGPACRWALARLNAPTTSAFNPRTGHSGDSGDADPQLIAEGAKIDLELGVLSGVDARALVERPYQSLSSTASGFRSGYRRGRM